MQFCFKETTSFVKEKKVNKMKSQLYHTVFVNSDHILKAIIKL